MHRITHDRLKSLLAYDPDTGVFTRDGKPAGYAHHTGYRYVGVDGETIIEHRLAWFYVYGVWPSADLDHINRVRSDNRIANLREVSRSENCQNQPIRRSNKSGRTGVYYHKVSGKWAATINVNRRQIHLGIYDTAEEAISVRRKAELEHYPYRAKDADSDIRS
jgi:hypothetical protein